MREVTALTKSIFNSGSKRNEYRLNPIIGASSSIEAPIYGDDFLAPPICTFGIGDYDKMAIGYLFFGTFNVSIMKNRQYSTPYINNPLPESSCFQLQTRLINTETEEVGEWVDLARYVVDKAKWNNKNISWDIECYDVSSFLDVIDFDSPEYSGEVIYPITFADAWNRIDLKIKGLFNELGLWEIGLPPLTIIGNSIIPEGSNFTVREIIGYILVLQGYSMNSDSLGQFRYFEPLTTMAKPSIAEIIQTAPSEIEYNENEYTISTVIIKNNEQSFTYPEILENNYDTRTIFTSYSPFATVYHAPVVAENLLSFDYREFYASRVSLTFEVEVGDKVSFNGIDFIVGYIELTLAMEMETTCSFGAWQHEVIFGNSTTQALNGNTVGVNRTLSWDSADLSKHFRALEKNGTDELGLYSNSGYLSQLKYINNLKSMYLGRVYCENNVWVDGQGGTFTPSMWLTPYDVERLRQARLGISQPFISNRNNEMIYAVPTSDMESMFIEGKLMYWLDGVVGKGIVNDPWLSTSIQKRPPMDGDSSTGDSESNLKNILMTDIPKTVMHSQNIYLKLYPLSLGVYKIQITETKFPFRIYAADNQGNIIVNEFYETDPGELELVWDLVDTDGILRLYITGDDVSGIVTMFRDSTVGEDFYNTETNPVQLRIHNIIPFIKPDGTDALILQGNNVNDNGLRINSNDGITLSKKNKPGEINLETSSPLIKFGENNIIVGEAISYGMAPGVLHLDHAPNEDDLKDWLPKDAYGLVAQYDPEQSTPVNNGEEEHIRMKSVITNFWTIIPYVAPPPPAPDVDYDPLTGEIVVDYAGTPGKTYIVMVGDGSSSGQIGTLIIGEGGTGSGTYYIDDSWLNGVGETWLIDEEGNATLKTTLVLIPTYKVTDNLSMMFVDSIIFNSSINITVTENANYEVANEVSLKKGINVTITENANYEVANTVELEKI